MPHDDGFDISILVFAKAPVPGRVNTRLAAAIGDERAAELHANLMQRTLAMAVAADLGPITLCCAPDTSHPCFQDAVASCGVTLATQNGADLGERMYRALATALEDCAASIIIGTDCPFLDSGYLSAAAKVLAAGQVPMVIGPAADGGYVLLGASRIHPSLFDDVPWGTHRVLPITRQRLQALDWPWRELAPLNDIDRPEDLALLEARSDH